MAADTAGTIGTMMVYNTVKIAKSAEGRLYGVCGCYAEACNVVSWVNNGCHGDIPLPRVMDKDEHSFTCLIVDPDGSIRVMTAHGYEIMHNCDYIAIGSGQEYAMGAMFAGADAETAVRASIRHDIYTGGDVLTVSNV